MLSSYNLFKKPLDSIKGDKLLISTINAHSYNVSLKDAYFCDALKNSHVLLPDGISMVLAARVLGLGSVKKIAGADLFAYEMQRMQSVKGKVFFLGSSDATLSKIVCNAKVDYPLVEVHTYSPPFKSEFTAEDNRLMVDLINEVKPDVLFVGMTAPKQEKWAYQNFSKLQVGHVCSIGAVFDFYAGTIKRAPQWMISMGLEWLFRLLKEPKRMWRRSLLGSAEFLYHLISEKLRGKPSLFGS